MMNIDEQVRYLMQGTEYGDDALKQSMAAELKERLLEAKKENRPLRVYCGFDPRTANLHLGHTVPMRKLRQFQELGHDVTFVVGNYTSLIGDPSDKDVLRPRLTPEEVDNNARTYAEQSFRILDRNRTQIRYNSEWLSKLNLARLIELASNFTLQQFLTRENFKKRWENGDAVYLHETFYSIMQGYDAYMLKADVQVGGTDQLFNIITAARKLMTYLGEKPNIGIIMGILPGTDGSIKMSKSLGNDVPISTNAEDMFGKVMSIPDFAMPAYFRLVTRWTPVEIDGIEAGLKNEITHPRDVKMQLAREITGNFYGDDLALEAEQAFVRQFQKREMPEEIPEFLLKDNQNILDILENAKLVKSRSEARRLVSQNGIRFNGEVVSDPTMILQDPGVLQVGKRHFIKLVKN